ncbi:MAG TPA: NADH-quinone oxidoreductase subunit NuoF [bacterium]
MKLKNKEDLQKLKDSGIKKLYPDKVRISVGMATCGLATGAEQVYNYFSKEIDSNGKFNLVPVGCIGFCQKEPLVDILIPGLPRVTFSKVNEEKAKLIFDDLKKDHINNSIAAWRFDEDEWLILNEKKSLVARDLPDAVRSIELYNNIAFFKKQLKIALRNCGFINPEDIEEYIARGGYFSLMQVLKGYSADQVIGDVKKSGLRGRGGAGFPTGLKWELCRKSKGETKYIICNADEGDPGAYMDRSILEGDPHSVIEGMVIGAYAIGAQEGYIYVRTEYPLAIERFKKAISDAEESNLLGDNILGTNFNFKIKMAQGSGAFVCGEETSLISSIEGKSPEPRLRPPFPAESGLWGKPTNINNVETWANIPVIIARGGDWFSRIGTEKSKGTKVFSLVGKIENTGLIEVPMGMKLDEIIEMGGGIPKNRKFKAIQTGGPSGGCLPLSHINQPVDYEKLAEAGSIMGSGGMIVMDERTCMVDIARYFLEFLKDESCGKCSSCREGTREMYEIVDRISRGEGKEGDIDLLENLGKVVKSASMCGLGQTAANPVLSTIRYFRDEYEEHIKHKRCPAIVCKEIVSSPCQHTCPIGTEAQLYVSYIASRKFEQALEVITRDNPMPASVSRICHHPCERMSCRAGDIGEPINIRGLKRFVIDWATAAKKNIEPPGKTPATGKKIAIVGAGPAGLTAGYYLCLKGHKVTVFDSEQKPGGMLLVGIPEYRLPRPVLDFDIQNMKKAGLEIKNGVRIGEQVSIDELLKQGYDAVFVAVGAHESIKMGVVGEDHPRVLPGMKFLRAVHTGQKVDLGNKVCVIGGGNSAIDAARVALRLGCEVEIYYRRTRSEMPAFPEEIEGALEEGVKIQYLVAPQKIAEQNGKLLFTCSRMALGEIDSSGRRKPVPIPGSEFTTGFDTIIAAVSEQPQTGFLAKHAKLTKWGTVDVNAETLQSSHPQIFAGGDAIRGPSTAIEAIRDGKLAAESIDSYLKKAAWMRKHAVTRPSIYVEPVAMTEVEMADYQRVKMPGLAVSPRINKFPEIDNGYTEEMAIKEARRCLHCDLETTQGQEFVKKCKERK